VDFATTGSEAFGPNIETTSQGVDGAVSAKSRSKTSADVDFQLKSIKSQSTLRTKAQVKRVIDLHLFIDLSLSMREIILFTPSPTFDMLGP